MLKKILLAVAVALPMFASAQTAKMGIVDTNAVFQAMPETAAAQTKLQEIQKKYQEEFTRLEDEYKRMVDELQKMKEDELPAIRERKTREISDYQQKIQTFMQSADQDIAQQQQQLMAPVQEKVVKAIQAIGAEGNYTFVFENMVPVYVGTDVTDITPTVKTRLGIK